MERRWDTLFDKNESSADIKDKINTERTSERWWEHCLEMDRNLKHSLMLCEWSLEIDKRLKSADLTEEQTTLMIRKEKCNHIKQDIQKWTNFTYYLDEQVGITTKDKNRSREAALIQKNE